MKRSSLLLSCLGVLLGISACAGAPGADDGSTQDARAEASAQDVTEAATPAEGGASDAATDSAPAQDVGPDASAEASAADAAPEASALDAGPDASALDAAREAGALDVSVPEVVVNDSGASADDGTPTCPGTMHVCLCATGYYCLRIGASCLAPTAPCP